MHPIDRTQWRILGGVAWAVVAVLLVVILGGGAARAQGSAPEPIDCTRLAQLVARVGTYRDLEASEVKVAARVLEMNADAPAMHRETIRREIRRLWREGLPLNDAVVSVYVRCTRVLGDMGRDS